MKYVIQDKDKETQSYVDLVSPNYNTVTHQFVLSVTVQESSPENVLALRDKILHKLKDDQDLLSENFNYISDMSIKAL